MALTINENGIFHKATSSVEEYKIKSIKEKIELKVIEYEANLKEKTLYYFLSQVENLESISPDNDLDGLPYILIVEGYQYKVQYMEQNPTAIEVIYLGKDTKIIPQIKKFEITLEDNKESANINLIAETKDDQGLSKIQVLLNDVVIQEKEISGKRIEETINISANGNYQVKVIGKNLRFVVSEEKQINTIENIKIIGILEVGTEIDDKIKVTVTATSSKTMISKIDLYSKDSKIGEEIYTGNSIQEIYTMEVNTKNFIFYEENKVYGIIESTDGTIVKTNEVEIGNRSKIRTEKDIQNFTQVVNNGNDFLEKVITQENDIYLTNNHIAIGTIQHPFRGTYDGQNKKIENIKINSSNSEQGYFGTVENGIVKNVIIGTGNIQGTYNVGGVVGYNYNGKVNNCTNQATKVTATKYININYTWDGNSIEGQYANVGGIIGYNYNGNVEGCTNQATIKGSHKAIGGIIGNDEGNISRTISNCKNLANIENTANSSTSDISWGEAGIVGVSYNLAKIENSSNSGNISYNGISCGGIVGILTKGDVSNCTNEGKITGKSYIGGICGEIPKINYYDTNEKSSISNCINTGKIQATGVVKVSQMWNNKLQEFYTSSIGGILGINNGAKIEFCTNKGSISATAVANSETELGGIVGFSYNNSHIIRCSNLVAIGKNDNNVVGGIAGFLTNSSVIEECYNTGTITGGIITGGIIGDMTYATVKNCYNTGNIVGNLYVGGILGEAISYNLKMGYNFLYNCYNIGVISGNNFVDPIGGRAEHLTWDRIYTLAPLYTSDGEWINCVGGDFQAFPESTAKSDLYKNLIKDQGASVWSMNPITNSGYPYIKYNDPKN